MKRVFLKLSSCLLLNLLALGVMAQHEGHHMMNHGSAGHDMKADFKSMPDVIMTNQYGESVNLHHKTHGKIAVVNFIFTTCTTICPPMGANLMRLKEIMGAHAGKELEFISVSIDPVTDTPERLKVWSENFGDTKNWTLLTGDKSTVEGVLKDLKLFTPLIEEHAPIMLIGNTMTGEWERTNGLASPDDLAGKLKKLIEAEFPEPDDSKEVAYFTNTPLIDQHGNEVEFYTDLLKDKIVVMNSFFAECQGICPVINTKMQYIYEQLGDRVGKDINLLSITVDPENDSPAVLKEYASNYADKDQKGWYFLTGSRENVETVLSKLGYKTVSRDNHKSIFLIGNVSTKLWKKAKGVADAEDIFKVVQSVISDNL